MSLFRHQPFRQSVRAQVETGRERRKSGEERRGMGRERSGAQGMQGESERASEAEMLLSAVGG